jgi:purine-nucleoside phosphorylase
MYREFKKEDFQKEFNLGDGYNVSGFLVYGTYKDYPYEMLKESLKRLGYRAKFQQPPHDFLAPILEFKINGKNFWFVRAYGGALLCEWLHLACLFGSQKNIVLGSCGGLFKQANTRDIIIPQYSFANESTTRAYESSVNNKHYADNNLRKNLIKILSKKHQVWEGPTITNEAMLAETREDVLKWSNDGYYGVEMEAATVFAVSRHFKIPSAAIMMILDNLIKEETVLNANHADSRDLRLQVSADMFDAALKVMLK